MTRWTALTAFSFLVILSATILAYLRLIPTEIKDIPYYDTIGHFVLFGALAFFFDQMLKKRNLHFGNTVIPLAGVLVTLYAAVDESLQGFSNARSLDWTDFLSGFVGVIFAVVLSRKLVFSKPVSEPDAEKSTDGREKNRGE